MFRKCSILTSFRSPFGRASPATKYRGARDLLVVKVSAPYDAWRPKKCRKTKMTKTTNIFIKSKKKQEHVFFFWRATQKRTSPSNSTRKATPYRHIFRSAPLKITPNTFGNVRKGSQTSNHAYKRVYMFWQVNFARGGMACQTRTFGIHINTSTSYKCVNTESNKVLGYLTCWIQQGTAPAVLYPVGFSKVGAWGSVNVIYFTV